LWKIVAAIEELVSELEATGASDDIGEFVRDAIAS
jgi:hypothetical protein